MHLWLTWEQTQTLVQHALDAAPYECCGLLAGQGGQVTRIVPIPNVADDPQHFYRLDPQALTRAFFDLQRSGLRLLAFYHSHPRGEPVPSETDVAQALYPDVAYLILGLGTRDVGIAAWQITHRQVYPVLVHIGELPPQLPAEMTRAQRTAIILSAIIAVIIVLVVSLSLLPPPPSLPIR